jgi:pullulanase
LAYGKNKKHTGIRLQKYFRYCFLPVFLIVFACSNRTDSLNDQADSGDTLIVYYYRYMEDYAGWNMWIWPADGQSGGSSYPFNTPDAEGFVTAHIVLPEIKGDLGMIVRKSEPGKDWVEKDGNKDRFTGEKEVWLVQGDPVVYTEKPDITDPPITFAVADSADKVTVYLLKKPSDYGSFAVYEGDKKLPGKSEQGKSASQIIISLDEKIAAVSKLYIVRDESGGYKDKPVSMRNILDNYYYGGNDLGLSYRATEAVFKLWSPTAASVSVALYDDAGIYNPNGQVRDNETENLYPMQKDPQSGLWSVSIQGNLEGKYYLYRVEFAEGVNPIGQTVNYAVDPYAVAVSANGQRTAIVNMTDTNPPGWSSSKPPFTAMQDAILYELHVRDFSIDENSGMKNKGKFLAFTEHGAKNSAGFPTGIDHLAGLGITHVHLLPSFDFATVNELTVDDPASAKPKFNWGYDPQNYNVPEGSYSTDSRNPRLRITEFKQMVQALHDAGIRVVMDVVYNHTFQSGAGPFDHIVPVYYYRTTDTGDLANGSACGNEVASERPMVRKYIIDSVMYWAKEYNIDGFRFDLMGLIDTPTIQQLTTELRSKIDPSIIIYGEPWQAGGSVLPQELQTIIGAQKGLGFAVFNDRIRTAIKGGSDDDTRGFASGEPEQEEGIVKGIIGSVNDFTACASESINYVTAHDNLNLWDKMALSLGTTDLATEPYALIDPAKNLLDNEAVKAVLLANGIVFTSQGIPFFQAGDEFLRSKFGDHNSYASPDSINMIRWENAALYRPVIEYYAGLIKLRKEHPAFRMDSKEDIERHIEISNESDNVVSFILRENANGDPWRTLFIAYNADSKPVSLDLPQTAHLWYQVVNSQKAGTETLAKINGKVTIPPLSLAVLHD